MKKVRATARVRVTIDVQLTDTWDETCSAAQINQDARRCAINRIDRLIDPPKHVIPERRPDDYTIVGTPEVTLVFVEEGAR